METDWIFRILKILCHKNAYSRNLYLEGHIRILMLKGHKSFLEFFWNLFCQLEGCVLMAIYVTHHNFAEVYIFEFLPLCALHTGCSGSNWHTLNRFYGRLNGFLGYSMVPIMFTTLWHFVFYLTFPKKYSEGGSIELFFRILTFFWKFFWNFFFTFFALKYLF